MGQKTVTATIGDTFVRGIRLLAVIGFFSVVNSVSISSGQTTTWTGMVDNDFFTSGNWNNGIPTPTTRAIFDISGQASQVSLGTGAATSDTFEVKSEFLFQGQAGNSYTTNTASIEGNTTLDSLDLTTDIVYQYEEMSLRNKSKLTVNSQLAVLDTSLNLSDSSIFANLIGVTQTPGSNHQLLATNGSGILAHKFEIGRPQFVASSVEGYSFFDQSELNTDELLLGGGQATGANRAALHAQNGSTIRSTRTAIQVGNDVASNWAGFSLSTSYFENRGDFIIGTEASTTALNRFASTQSISIIGGHTSVEKNGEFFLTESTFYADEFNQSGSAEIDKSDLILTNTFRQHDGLTEIKAGSFLLGPRVEVFGGKLHSVSSDRISTGSFSLYGGTYTVDDLDFGHLNSVVGIAGKMEGTITHTAGNIFNAYSDSNYRMSADVDTSGVLIKNYGTIETEPDGFGGTARIIGALDNQTNGEVRVSAGHRLRFASPRANHVNKGRIDTVGTNTSLAELEFEGAFTNEFGGLITARNSVLRFDRGISNDGRISSALGDVQLYGDIDNTSDGAIGVGGNSTLALLGDLKQNGDFHIFAGSRAVIFGDFSGAGGTSGTGTLEILGRTTIGNSPASVNFGGDFVFGEEALFELGGLGVGEFDQLNVAGDLTLGGDLMVTMWDSWQLSAGQEYLIANVNGNLFGQFIGLDEGDRVGTFGNYDLFISYTAGDGNDVSLFSAVPEPSSMLVLTIAFLATMGSRRRRAS